MPRPTFEEIWRKRFTERGRVYDDDAAIAGWTESGLEVRLRHFQRVWPGDTAGARWLDVGCGAGSYTRYLASQGVAPLGVDYSLPSLQKARSRSDASIPWLVGDATQLPLRPASVDGVMCFGVMQALSGPDRAVHELLALTRPGGQIWIDALNRHALTTVLNRLRARLRRRPLGLRYDSPAQLIRLLRAAGATEIRLYWVPILPGSLRRFQPWLESRPVRGLLAHLPWLASPLSHAFLIAARKADH
ncbi:class I SAM-dependent methyltransferase [Thiohalophilus thiocyanatoxydans]|uniref:2-polyprenyl-3-methyl-5-hydroxy-6-metoxy-1, 4-benzoquinol methylase n=1 Tax=Thiohalophilus thiocyanatoxydans TaxID=381308 RepID=A0A4R8IRU1_9GAMM|nr:class I SAM-dependent methyltransferase [Thiohalophilus thiocyanatoxydans]TDY03752.1 2-polyprenyl-3-methyl-5-hydroxy-6-metoxy-1,4-benzoquinol methylase [Thiohalophilus thiocyanatoxydans]